MEECSRKGKWFGGCNFEARHDKSGVDLARFKNLKAQDPEYLEKMRTETYVKDICTTCGKVINRGDMK